MQHITRVPKSLDTTTAKGAQGCCSGGIDAAVAAQARLAQFTVAFHFRQGSWGRGDGGVAAAIMDVSALLDHEQPLSAQCMDGRRQARPS
jgi:hypothetical protein